MLFSVTGTTLDKPQEELVTISVQFESYVEFVLVKRIQKKGFFGSEITKVMLTWDGVSPRSHGGRLHWDNVLRGDIFFVLDAD
ncbi:hypothetical protein V6N11_060193 [Hibiscus sabdariffa]|uniref:Uncharacterized protein n=1 Tax=Hibiscus sabdariffa TaxID=183260 RepID=A0ABR1Z8P5_9ROSI